MPLQLTTPMLYPVSFLSAPRVGEAVMFALNKTRGWMIFEYINSSEGPYPQEALVYEIGCKYQGL